MICGRLGSESLSSSSPRMLDVSMLGSARSTHASAQAHQRSSLSRSASGSSTTRLRSAPTYSRTSPARRQASTSDVSRFARPSSMRARRCLSISSSRRRCRSSAARARSAAIRSSACARDSSSLKTAPSFPSKGPRGPSVQFDCRVSRCRGRVSRRRPFTTDLWVGGLAYESLHLFDVLQRSISCSVIGTRSVISDIATG